MTEMAKRRTLTLDERIDRAQELGRQRWNTMVHKEEVELRRAVERSDREAKVRRARMHIVR